MSADILVGAVEVIGVRLVRSSTGAAITGATVRVASVIRSSDGKVYDFNTSTFVSSGGTQTQALSESSNQAGTYTYAWNTGAITNPTTPDTYHVAYEMTSPSSMQLGGDEIRVRAIAAMAGSSFASGDDLHAVKAAIPSAATVASTVWGTALPGAFGSGTAGYNLDAQVSAAGGGSLTVQQIVDGVWNELASGHTTSGSFGARIDATISSRLASASYSAPPSASAISTQVAADLATAHGSGSWATATSVSVASNGISSASLAASAITAIQSGLATSSAVAALPSASAIATAVGNLSLSGLTDPTTMGGAVSLTRKWSTWTNTTQNDKRIVGQNLVIYDDDGSTVLATVPLKDYTGGTITPAAGEPAQLG